MAGDKSVQRNDTQKKTETRNKKKVTGP